MESFGENSSDNLIICGDSLNALTSLTKIPEYRQKYVNKIKLIYIDPPFNTGQMFANYDELLGDTLREYLSKLDDLVIFADEHHLYYGEKFSEAIRELKPKILIGLTGTPHEKTPPKEVIFEYPL